MDDRTYGNALARAGALGDRAGARAGNSFFDGNTDRETYQRVLTGISDGDPAILDQLPYFEASEAEELEIYEEIVEFVNREDSESPEENDLLETYADAFALAAVREIERIARGQLAD